MNINTYIDSSTGSGPTSLSKNSLMWLKKAVPNQSWSEAIENDWLEWFPVVKEKNDNTYFWPERPVRKPEICILGRCKCMS